jgi:hypothetical protein
VEGRKARLIANKFNEFGGNFVEVDMVKSFTVAGEYRHGFGT